MRNSLQKEVGCLNFVQWLRLQEARAARAVGDAVVDLQANAVTASVSPGWMPIPRSDPNAVSAFIRKLLASASGMPSGAAVIDSRGSVTRSA